MTEELDVFFIKLIELLAHDNNNKTFFLDSKLFKKINEKIKTPLTNILEFDFSE